MEIGPVDTVGEGEGGMSREGSTEARPLPRAKRTAGGKLLWGQGASSALYGDPEPGRRGGSAAGERRGYTYTQS